MRVYIMQKDDALFPAFHLQNAASRIDALFLINRWEKERNQRGDKYPQWSIGHAPA